MTTAGSTARKPILDVRDLATYFYTERGVVRAVDGVSFNLGKGEILGIVGESGCGKSMTALSIMRLIRRPGRIVRGEVVLKGRDLITLSEREMRSVRGGEIGMVFQEPMTSLNPVLSVGRQLQEAMETHGYATGRAAMTRAADLLSMVGIPDPSRRLSSYPHELSGGQRQRVMIAAALSCEPAVILADEATTALDVTIQAQILELLYRVVAESGTSLIVITHNLGLLSGYADQIVVMYAGRVRESGRMVDVYANAAHPYTIGLMSCVPGQDSVEGHHLLPTVDGESPDPLALPSGCAFSPRCPWSDPSCDDAEPPIMAVGEGNHEVSCFKRDEVSGSHWPTLESTGF